MVIVADASLALKWYLDEALADEADDWLTEHQRRIVVPEVFLIEVTGALVRRANIDKSLRAASEENNWDLHYGEIAKIFRAGCIIRAQFLQKITDAYANDADIANLLLDPYFKNIADEYQQALRDVVSYAIQNGIPTPTFSAAIAYYDSYRSEVLPANLIQAQRDYFGAHTYKRIDKDGVFHTEWLD